MAYGTPTDPVGGTVITVAYAVANIIEPIKWLRAMTGNADPPGSNYVVVSTSTTGTSWQKVPADALAAGVAVANLGFAPINKAGDTGIGNLTSTGTIAAAALTASGNVSAGGNVSATGTVVAGTFQGGSTGSGAVSASGLAAGASGISSAGPITGLSATTSGNVASGGTVSAAAFSGGSTGSGSVSAAALAAGASGISSTGTIAGVNETLSGALGVTGAVTAGSYNGGTTASGGVSAAGLAAGASGITSVGNILENGSRVYTPANPPPLGTGAAVPAGLIAAFQTAAAIASGWARFTSLDGRMPVGAGTTFSTTWTENNAYGSSWSHAHNDAGHQHSSAALGVGGGIDNSTAANGVASGAGNAAAHPHSHTHTLDVTGSTDTGNASISGTAWTIPSFAVVWAQKS